MPPSDDDSSPGRNDESSTRTCDGNVIEWEWVLKLSEPGLELNNASDHFESPPVSGLLGRGESGFVAGKPGGGRGIDAEASPVRMGVIGVGNRGTALLRALLELPGTPIVAVCDFEPKHRQRGQGIVEKARGQRPDAYDDPRRVLDRPDIDAVVVAVPCDAHEAVYRDAIMAGKHLYAEKPLALSLAGCDRLIAEAAELPADSPRWISAAVESEISGRGRADSPGRAGRLDRGPRHVDQQQGPDERPRRLAGPSRAVGRLDGRTGRARLGHSAMVHR